MDYISSVRGMEKNRGLREFSSAASMATKGTLLCVLGICGKEVEVDALDNQTNRCKECYNTYRRKAINENAKKYYQKKKNK